MNMNSKREDIDAADAMNEGRGLCRVLVWAVLAIIVGICLLAASGCSTFGGIGDDDIERLDQLARVWIDRIEAAQTQQTPPTPPTPPTQPDGGTIETPPTPQPEEPTTPGAAVDALDFAILKWQYGGKNCAGAKLDAPRLSGLSCNGSKLSYRWKVGLKAWGLSDGDAGAICAVFFERSPGQWVGGKFDWVSTSRSNRELKHVESYSNWPSSGIKLPWRGKVAYVVVSADGRRRSNVLVAEAK